MWFLHLHDFFEWLAVTDNTMAYMLAGTTV